MLYRPIFWRGSGVQLNPTLCIVLPKKLTTLSNMTWVWWNIHQNDPNQQFYMNMNSERNGHWRGNNAFSDLKNTLFSHSTKVQPHFWKFWIWGYCKYQDIDFDETKYAKPMLKIFVKHWQSLSMPITHYPDT